MQQQEQDPTNLYIANLPINFKESDVDSLLVKHGPVISTRILRDASGISKGVGFARLESKEKCEQIIQMFNGVKLSGCKEPLLVKFADGGNKKKNIYKNNENNKVWRESAECLPTVPFDPNSLAQNGVATPHMMPALNFRPHYSQVVFLNYLHVNGKAGLLDYYRFFTLNEKNLNYVLAAMLYKRKHLRLFISLEESMRMINNKGGWRGDHTSLGI